MPQKGDFLIDKQYLFEVGGRSKGYKQIAGIENSFVVQDDVEFGLVPIRVQFLVAPL